MAGPGSGAASITASASVVGNAFVNQYYHVLHQSPQVVHRFYTNASKLTRAEAGAGGAVDTVESQPEIHNKVMLLDYTESKAEIKTVDSQDSHQGGVIVMVTGSLSSKTSGKRNFVQTFFLAPQEKGYFVLNDMFRYLDEAPQQGPPAAPLSNGIPEPPQVLTPQEAVLEPALPAEHEVRELSSPRASDDEAVVEEGYELPDRVELSEPEDDGISEDAVLVRGEATVPVMDEAISPIIEPPSVQPSTEESTPGEIPKKSYASILRLMKEGGGAQLPAPHYNPAPKVSPAPDRPAAVNVQPVAAPRSPPAQSQDASEETIIVENEADGRSVYVKNLPLHVTAQQLEEEFSRFGPVKPGGVNVKSQKQQGVCYAFIEFDDASAAHRAIEAGSTSLGGRHVYIEEKRPLMLRGGSAGRGRPPAGRGDRPYRPENSMRGRGLGVGGGRGMGGGRGGQQDRGETYYRGRGGQGRGGYSGGSGPNLGNNFGANATGDNYRKSEGQAGNMGPKPVRRGPSNQMSRNNLPLAHDAPPPVPIA